MANGLCRPGDAAIVPNPIDPADVVAPERSDHDPVTVGFLGGVTHRKGFDLVPPVVDALAEEPVKLQLYVNLDRHGRSPAIWEQLDRWGPTASSPSASWTTCGAPTPPSTSSGWRPGPSRSAGWPPRR